MITLLSPAKSMDYNPAETNGVTLPRMLDQSMPLVSMMKRKSKKSLKELMSISDNLAALNKERFTNFSEEHTSDNAKQAVLTFNGEVYWGLDANTLGADQMEWTQDHLRILSGLYGVLRPLDLIQPYRLEMGTRLKTRRGKDLYAWWGERITKQLNEDLEETGNSVIFNLASKEYAKAVDMDKLNARVYSANFFEFRKGKYQFISFTAKRARGWLARYIIDNKITDPELTKGFDTERFEYLEELSSDNHFVFVR